MSEHFHQVQLHFKTSKHASLSTWLDILSELLSATVRTRRTRLKTSPLPSDSVHNELCSANTISCIKHCSSIDDIASHPLWTQWNICFLAFSFYFDVTLVYKVEPHLCLVTGKLLTKFLAHTLCHRPAHGNIINHHKKHCVVWSLLTLHIKRSKQPWWWKRSLQKAKLLKRDDGCGSLHSIPLSLKTLTIQIYKIWDQSYLCITMLLVNKCK